MTEDPDAPTLRPGEWILAGEYGTEHYDHGEIISIDGDTALVNWQGCAIGKSLTVALSDCEPWDGEKWQRHCTAFAALSE